VDDADRVFAVRDGVLFNKALTTLLAYPAGKPGKSYAVPAGVTGIEDRAFAGCGNLIAVSLPESITSIGESVFDASESLETISLSASIPPALDGDLETSAVIYVPAASVTAYKKAADWEEHADQIQAAEAMKSEE
jgi:hypothetical protein